MGIGILSFGDTSKGADAREKAKSFILCGKESEKIESLVGNIVCMRS